MRQNGSASALESVPNEQVVGLDQEAAFNLNSLPRLIEESLDRL